MLFWGAAAVNGGWNVKHIGYGLVIVGGLTQIAESYAQSEALTSNVPVSQTSFGSLVAPIEKYLPFQLGWTLMLIGAALVWVLPLVKKG